MMRANRVELLQVFESVSPGLASREILEQSSCLVFDKGRVITFNDAVACSRQSPLNLQGAVKAKPLIDLLSRLTEDELGVEIKDNKLCIRGAGRRKAYLTMEQQVQLPIESVEVPDNWRDLDAEFTEAVKIVASCASTEESQFELTCVHIHPEWLEACDRFQIARFPMKTGMSTPILVKAESLRKMAVFDMTKVCETQSWIHFSNKSGLVLSCRRYMEAYKDLGRFLDTADTEPATLPGGLEEVVQRAEVFSADNAAGNHLKVTIRPDGTDSQKGWVSIVGEGVSGGYEEQNQVSYQGPPISFLISPKLLLEVSKKQSTIRIGERKICVDGGKFKFMAATEMPASKEASAKEE